MREMIHDGAGELELERLAREDSPSIRQDGWRLVLKGVTTVEEVMRVTQGD
jgi:general secretion pathway protein E